MEGNPKHPPPDVANIEGDATEGELRYWRSKEAVRQGEARLAAHSIRQ